MRKKPILLLLFLAVFSLTVQAKNYLETDFTDNRYEIIGGFGLVPIHAYYDTGIGAMDIWYNGPESVHDMYDYCYDATYSMTYSLEFAYHFKDRWDFCASAGYSTVDITYFDPFTDQELSKDHSYSFDLQAGVRRYHVIKNSFRLYSQATIGFCIHDNSHYWDIICSRLGADATRYVAFQITGLGLSFGKKLFASGEFGWGTDYCMVGVMPGMKLGVGYRF